MNQEMTEILAAMGDRSNRDTAHLLDLAIAGSIDHLRGHGSVRLLPARLEEIAGRIAPRTRDEDGAWIVTLAPPGDDLVAVNAYDVLEFIHQTRYGCGEQPGDLAAFICAAAVQGTTLNDMISYGFPEFVAWVEARYA